KAVEESAAKLSGSLIILPDTYTTVHRDTIIELAGRHQLPSIYPFRYFATQGGLVSYGVDAEDLVRRAAGYIDRILKGEKPADLPVQAPVKYELVINRKAAKSLGLTVSATLLARADEVMSAFDPKRTWLRSRLGATRSAESAFKYYLSLEVWPARHARNAASACSRSSALLNLRRGC